MSPAASATQFAGANACVRWFKDRPRPTHLALGVQALAPLGPQLFQGPTSSTCNQGTAGGMSRTAVASRLQGANAEAGDPRRMRVLDRNVGGAQALAAPSLSEAPSPHPHHPHTVAGKGHEHSCFGCTVCGCEPMRTRAQGQAMVHSPGPPGYGAGPPWVPSTPRAPPPAPAAKPQQGA